MLAPHKLLPVSILLVLTLVLSALLSACSPVYVIRAAYEEGKILWRRQPIADYIQKPDVTAETQEKLKTVLAVRDYARDVLKFNVGGSYASYSYVDRPDLTYVVVAAPKTELRPYTWWFLIVGNVPYKGYFSRPDAEAEIERLKADGYDTSSAHLGGVQHAWLVRRSAAIPSAQVRQSRPRRDRFSRTFSQHALPGGEERFQRKRRQLHRPSCCRRFFSR